MASASTPGPAAPTSGAALSGASSSIAVASYSRAVSMAALQAAFGAAWIAARELSPARRRLTRVGTVAVVGVAGYLASPPAGSAEPPASPGGDLVVGARPFPVAEGAPSSAAEPFVFDKRKAAVGLGVIALSVAAIVGRRQLEKRWLARLTRAGHPHPTRALAVRMAGVEFAGQLALQLADRRKARTETTGSTRARLAAAPNAAVPGPPFTAARHGQSPGMEPIGDPDEYTDDPGDPDASGDFAEEHQLTEVGSEQESDGEPESPGRWTGGLDREGPP